ncbi:restriction endonuclease [Sphingobacterium sp. DR205]|uniref:restriction endonuclease n=1 Tax=Sphingobacterium sp. DR205 TaxID=2713573 RepID=UPI0013E510A6|nr:restriction endonuclease [Sphingobacterium sp. DR205]QIH33879.1 restriction endonuclease [Sphingobacterium sp. DR205]
MSKGKQYELLVERLFKQLAPNAEIKQDDYILGKNSNTKRQIDVSIRFQNMGISYLTIIQAKDYSRPADIKVVDEFKSVIEDTLANKGILICNKGFTKKAKEYGKKVGIELLSIHEASDKNWQTLVYIRIKKTIYKIKLDAELGVGWYNNTGKTATLQPDHPPIFSINMKDLFSTPELFRQEVLNKNLWAEIIKGVDITIDLKKISAYVFMHDRFLDPIVGKLTYKYLRTESKNLLVEPDNYLYQVDHITGEGKLHNLILTPTKFDEIVNPHFKSEEYFDQTEPHFEFITIEIINNGYFSFYLSNVQFEIDGPNLPDDNPNMQRINRYSEIGNMIKQGVLRSNT